MQVIAGSEWLAVSYIVATCFFIFALKGLGTEASAMRGTQCGILGMLATVAAAFCSDFVNGGAYYIIPVCLIPTSAFGVWYAYSVETDRLPELVGLFNSFGGLAAALEGIAVYLDKTSNRSMYTGSLITPIEQRIQLVGMFASIIVGMMTFTGSIIAVLKLTDAWVKVHYHKTDVEVHFDGIAVFPGNHGLTAEDALGAPNEKGRQNRYAAKIEFSHDVGKLTVYEVLDPKRVRVTTGTGPNDFQNEGRTGGSCTAKWSAEKHNFWHIDTKPRTYMGGKIPQMILCVVQMGCCVMIWKMDRDGLALYQNANEGLSWAEGNAQLYGTVLILLLALVAGAVGVLQALAVSGADMAVVICVLNSGSGWSGVAAGFMISNELLLVTGAFVGASGAILSYLMCAAMNVPILRVLGMMPPPPEVKAEVDDDAEALPEPQKENANQVAERIREANTIVICPGYGMAAGKAQGVVAKLTETLRAQGKNVRFCIHPVAGRLPGHMNILLAEAQVPYDWVCAMDEINKDFKNMDLALCIGAWDTVNPAAAEDPDCPVYGMPMCRVWDAKVCIVNKRSLGSNSGFSGAVNILPHKENTRMLLGSAVDEVQKLLDIVSQDAKQESFGTGADMGASSNGSGVPTSQELAVMPTYKTIAVPKETSDPAGEPLVDFSTELRCALSPKAALHLRKVLGFKVVAESGVGLRSLISDDKYREVGVEIVPTGEALYAQADVLLKLNPPIARADLGGKHELDMLKPNSTYISFLPIMNPRENPESCSPTFKDIVLRAQQNKINLLSMGHLPRISRAQKSDAISTFGKLAGHRACVEAAAAFGQIMSGEITSAGNNPQAKAWVGGCGVAGLEAVAILKKMGCEVYATDVRDIEDQIISVGGKFVHYDPEGLKRAKDSGGYAPTFGQEMQDQQDRMYTTWSKKCDVMILTAAIPGMPPPRLVSKAMVDRMEPGSVIVDIAANKSWGSKYARAERSGALSYTGREATPWPGNCEYTRPGELFITSNGVKVVGYTDLPSRFGKQATNFYANNLVNLLEDMCAKGTVAERGMKEPELGTARDFKIDMHVVRSQTNDHRSFSEGEFAIGDDIMAGMCLVKVENGQAMLDYPKKRKPMETAQAIFEKEIKSQGASLVTMEQKLVSLKQQAGNSSRNLMAKYSTEDVGAVHDTVRSIERSHQKIEASLQFEETKQHNDMVKWMSGMIKTKKQDIMRADKEARLAALEATSGGGDGLLTQILVGGLGIGSCYAMGFVPFPEYFIGNAMIFALASVLGYCLCANVKPSLHTPLMSMSNAISGIVIIGGMYQIHGDYIWGGTRLMEQVMLERSMSNSGMNKYAQIDQEGLDGGMNATQVLGSIAVAVSAINIAGGFAVTFRMLEMFKASPTNGGGGGENAYTNMDIGQATFDSCFYSIWPLSPHSQLPLSRNLSTPVPPPRLLGRVLVPCTIAAFLLLGLSIR